MTGQGEGGALDLRFCAYYRGIGTCSFGCYGPDGPRCMELGRPTSEDLAELEAAGAEVSDSFREVTGQGEGGAVLGEEAQVQRELFEQSIRADLMGSGAVGIGYRIDDLVHLIANNPHLRALVAQARADGAAEERERIARELDDEAQRWRDRPPVQSDAAVVAVGRDASIRATEYAARVARGWS